MFVTLTQSLTQRLADNRSPTGWAGRMNWLRRRRDYWLTDTPDKKANKISAESLSLFRIWTEWTITIRLTVPSVWPETRRDFRLTPEWLRISALPQSLCFSLQLNCLPTTSGFATDGRDGGGFVQETTRHTQLIDKWPVDRLWFRFTAWPMENAEEIGFNCTIYCDRSAVDEPEENYWSYMVEKKRSINHRLSTGYFSIKLSVHL